WPSVGSARHSGGRTGTGGGVSIRSGHRGTPGGSLMTVPDLPCRILCGHITRSRVTCITPRPDPAFARRAGAGPARPRSAAPLRLQRLRPERIAVAVPQVHPELLGPRVDLDL